MLLLEVPHRDVQVDVRAIDPGVGDVAQDDGVVGETFKIAAQVAQADHHVFVHDCVHALGCHAFDRSTQPNAPTQANNASGAPWEPSS